MQHLHGGDSIEMNMLALIDIGEATSSYQVDQAVVAKLLAYPVVHNTAPFGSAIWSKLANTLKIFLHKRRQRNSRAIILYAKINVDGGVFWGHYTDGEDGPFTQNLESSPCRLEQLSYFQTRASPCARLLMGR